MSKTQAIPEFEFVYSGSKTPRALHALVDGKECWAGHMRPATPEELERLRPEPICKHCAARIARATKAEEQPKAQRPTLVEPPASPNTPKLTAGASKAVRAAARS